jgi:hypothetical protein
MASCCWNLVFFPAEILVRLRTQFRASKRNSARARTLRKGSFHSREHSMTVRSSIEQVAKSVFGGLAPGAEGSGDILDTLHQEHDEVQELLRKLNDSDDAREQKSLVAKIAQALVPHTKAEEKVVYDPIAALSARRAKIDGAEGYTEHALASATLKQLRAQTANTPEFKASAKVLKELIDHHVKEEERNIWAQVRENFSSEQREQMNRDFLAAKKIVKV